MAAGQGDPEEAANSKAKRIRKNFQKTLTKELKKKVKIDQVSRARFKLARWNLGGYPGKTASRFIKAMERIKSLVPPKVCAAVLRTAWNGWCTARRFQGHGLCVFGCKCWIQEDSIEHYANCSISTTFIRKHLGYRHDLSRGSLVALGTHYAMPSDEDLLRLALWNFALYKAFNHSRHKQGNNLSLQEIDGLMLIYLREGASGSPQIVTFLEHCWDPEFRLGRDANSDSEDGAYDWESDA